MSLVVAITTGCFSAHQGLYPLDVRLSVTLGFSDSKLHIVLQGEVSQTAELPGSCWASRVTLEFELER